MICPIKMGFGAIFRALGRWRIHVASATTEPLTSSSNNRSVGGHGIIPVTGEDFATVLAHFACGISVGGLAAPVIAAARVNVFDTLACAAAGSSAPAVAETRELAVEWGGAPQ